jgi:alpha-methylacyl-CoA racemase
MEPMPEHPDPGVDPSRPPGPLAGVRVVEVGGIGPGPFAAMMLSDLGADVVRVDRPEEDLRSTHAVLLRGRRSVVADLKSPDGLAVVLALVDRADVLIEGFRPGVAERLGFGPSVALERNPRLVYGRMTGWGQDGPYAALAGHDLTYLAVTGVLDAFPGADGRPVPPLNLLGDFGGGGMLLVVGVLSALLEAQRSGKGQVIDAAMVDGAALLMSFVWGMRAIEMWTDRRTANPLDGAAPYYRSYKCADGRYISVGAMESQFYAQLVELTGLDAHAPLPEQEDPRHWPEMAERLAAIFKTKTRDEWVVAAAPYDACLTPVLDFDEVAAHPHIAARGTFTTMNGAVQPAPAPRFSRTPGAIQRPPAMPGDHTDEVLQEWLNVPVREVERLRRTGALR